MKIEYKPIPGFSRYVACSDGNIFNRRHLDPTSALYLKSSPLNVREDRESNGWRVSLRTDDGKTTARSPVQIICAAFHGDENGIVEFIDGNRDNWRADNLRWKDTTNIGSEGEILGLHPIPRLPGYFLTEDGAIYSGIGRQRDGQLRQMFPSRNPKGYEQVVIKGKTEKIHILMCETFLGPRPSEKHVARHLNGINNDNRRSNIAWGTHEDNKQDSILHGTSVRGETSGRAELTEVDVLTMRKLRVEQKLGWAELGRRFHVHPMTAKYAVNGKTWAHLPGATT